jgi:hypothetical protein
MRGIRWISLGSSALVAAAAMAVSGCGATKEAASVIDPVAQAAQATQTAGTAEVVFRGRVSVAGKDVPIDGRGVISTRDDTRSAFTMALHDGGRDVELKEIFDHDTLYLGGDGLAKDLPSGKSWAKIDLRRLARESGIDISQLDDGGGSGTREMLGYLRGAGSVHKVGQERVVGTTTTHYHAVVDVAKLARERGQGDLAATMRKLRTSLDGPMTLDLWIDGRHRVRQERLDYSSTVQGHAAHFAYTMQLTRFGVPLTLDVPSSDKVDDMTDRVAKQVKSGA